MRFQARGQPLRKIQNIKDALVYNIKKNKLPAKLLVFLVLLLVLMVCSGTIGVSIGRAAPAGNVDLHTYVAPLNPGVGETVVFGVGLTPAPGVEITWDFGDGTPNVTGWPVPHTYIQSAAYEIRATATPLNAMAPQFTFASLVITVHPQPNSEPHAAINNPPAFAFRDTVVTFDAQASKIDTGEQLSARWYFGDGTNGTGIKVNHTYTMTGNFTVVLFVFAKNGGSDTSLFKLHVVTTPAPPRKVGDHSAAVQPERLLFPYLPLAPPTRTSAAPQLASLLDYRHAGVWEAHDFPGVAYPIPLSGNSTYNGYAWSNRPWLSPDPPKLQITGGTPFTLNLRNVAPDHLLPAQTNEATIHLLLNGTLFDVHLAVIARAPQEDQVAPTRVWALYHKTADLLVSHRQVDRLIGSADYPNAAQFILGMSVQYLEYSSINTRLNETDFSARLAELVAGQDYNDDGIVGFTTTDLHNTGLVVPGY